MIARALVALLAAALQEAAGGPSQDLLFIDTQVYQRDGSVLSGLKPGQFEVFIDDGSRPVISAELRPTPPGAGSSGPGRYPGGRVVMLAIDQASFPFSATSAAIEGANRIVAGLPANDYLGIVIFPEWASAMPTRDREAVRTLVSTVKGVRRDIAAPRFQISAGDALLLRSGDATALRTIVTRECEQAFSPTCRNEALQDGSAIAEVLEQQNRSSLTGLFAALDALAALPEAKTVILLSAGLPMTIRPGTRPDQSADVARLAQMTAVANADLHVVYLNGRYLRHFSPDYRKRHYAIFDDLRTFGTSLQTFSESGGGSFLQLEVAADPALERLLRESPVSYALGVKLRPEDRDGKLHTVRVNVKVRGATVRHRKVMTIPAPR